MSNISINTTQNVRIHYELASIGYRIISFLIDFFIQVGYVLILSMVLDVIFIKLTDNWTRIGVFSLLILPAMFYSLIMHIVFNGQTIGKMILKLRVVRLDGLPVHWSHYGIKWLLRLLDIWTFSGSIGFLAVIFTENRQTVGDRAAGTLLVNVKQRTKIEHTVLEDIQEDYKPTFLQVTLLKDKDIRLIKSSFLAAKSTNNYTTLKKLRMRLEEVLQTNSELYDLEYIDTVLKDYHHFTKDL
ncbi:MAG: RDD family protein [Flavobacteriaceae bacterium]|nr:RDD family protein [Flavobacteriaceae bacterium]